MESTVSTWMVRSSPVAVAEIDAASAELNISALSVTNPCCAGIPAAYAPGIHNRLSIKNKAIYFFKLTRSDLKGFLFYILC
ncbi:hypothetical protein D3C75_347800 [compost metagenome]